MDWQNGGITSNNNGHLETLRMISFYGRINYSFNSKYLLQATIRRDGSSVFGKNNRWGTFPSIVGMAYERRKVHQRFKCFR